MLIKRRQFLKGLSVAALATQAAPGFALTSTRTEAQIQFDWYCQQFYDFKKVLSPLEMGFLEHSMDLEGDVWGYDVTENSDFAYSMITFSHRVRDAQVNSSRVAMGSIRHGDKLHDEMAGILNMHGVGTTNLPDLEHMKGIGWDMEAGHLKVYFFLPDIERSRDPEIAALIEKAGDEAYYPMGITSFTVLKDEPALYEKKLYLAMRDRVPAAVKDHPFTDDIVHTNYMITNRRGVVPQVDVQQPFDPGTLSEPGQVIAAKYGSLGESIDTIAYQDTSTYTIYFP